jgi:phosphomethylpyrimidine synthase
MNKFDYNKEEIEKLAKKESVSPDYLIQNIESGRIVILKNKNHHKCEPVALGKGLKTKINVNLGTSPDFVNYELELEKLKLSIDLEADTIMDLSTGGDIRDLRIEMVQKSSIPVGTVPIYEAVCNLTKHGRAVDELTGEDLFSVIEDHLRSGVDFITVHCGLTQRAIPIIERQKRVVGIVSRGGAFLYRWMKKNKKENPLYEHYDKLLGLAKEYNATLSLGDGLRPGSIADATDSVQIEELLVLGELVQRAREKGVYAMVEGPGHIPLNEIESNVLLEKKICDEAPFYVLGPLVIDCAPGYDHIVSAIGGALAASCGADFLCYVTPAEHLSLPNLRDVRDGIVASKIAAHAADIVKNIPGARKRDLEISLARKNFDWEKMVALSLDPQKTKEKRGEVPADYKKCTMCGEFCAMRENL